MITADKIRFTKMPREKKPYTYYTLMMYRAAIIKRIAYEWWDIIPHPEKRKIDLVNEIIDAQVAEFGGVYA